MKTYTSHNTKLVQEDSWTTADKKPHIVISDTKNRYSFIVTFGKAPSVEIWRSKKNRDLVEKLETAKINKPPKQTRK